MNLVQMSAAGAVVIAAVILIRALAMHRLPKRSFLILWGVALARLLIPFRLRTPLSAYNLARALPAEPGASAAVEAMRRATVAARVAPPAPADAVHAAGRPAAVSPWMLVYLAGLIACLLFFGLNYVRCRREFRCSLPVRSAFARDWLAAHPLRRRVSLRQSDRVSTPLTYGLFRPVILMPKGMDWSDERALGYVLAHEHTHIRRFDAGLKLILIAAACVHWFNPLVWAMYVLANRDVELACDEAVVRRFGDGARADYAMALISMEERRSGRPVPLCAPFSKTAIEERIRAIMKFKRKSVLAALVAAAIVLGIAAAFATSAEDGGAQAQPAGAALAQADAAWLESLRFPGYEDMPVAEYRARASVALDSREALDRLERLAQDEELYAQRDGDELAAFLHDALVPLVAEQWRERDFGGSAEANAGTGDRAVLEYWGTLHILYEDVLTVGQYSAARKEFAACIQRRMDGMTAAELRDAAFVEEAVRAEIDRFAEEDCPEGLEIAADIFCQPLNAADVYNGRFGDIARKWDEELSPYVPFGLKYEYNPDFSGNGLHMEYEGQTVRGIVDGDGWITEHAGSGYPKDAIELYAVYEGDELVGLRPANAQEAEYWNQARDLVSEERPIGETRERMYAPGDVEDYRALLALMEPDYRAMRVSEFNVALLDCVDAMDGDSLEGILNDVMLDEFPLELSAEQRRFLCLTFPLSNGENAELVRALNAGVPQGDPQYGWVLLSKPSQDGLAWCSLWYQFTYRISDGDALTVGERDDCVDGFMQAVEDFWAETSLDGLLQLTEADVADRMRALAEAHSSAQLTIQLDGDQMQFEKMDERALAAESPRD